MSFAGVAASSCTIDGSGDAQGVWTEGIPSVSAPQVPVLIIKTVLAGAEAVHNVCAAPTETVDYPFVDPGVLAGITCSYAGGCEISLPVGGLTQDVITGKSKVVVGGIDATIDES